MNVGRCRLGKPEAVDWLAGAPALALGSTTAVHVARPSPACQSGRMRCEKCNTDMVRVDTDQVPAIWKCPGCQHTVPAEG